LLCPHFVCLDVAGAAAAIWNLPPRHVCAKNRLRPNLAQRPFALHKPPTKLFTRQDGIRRFCARCGDAVFHAAGYVPARKDADSVPFFGVLAAATASARLALAARRR
jgi:KDO2-lipid IV(A) lauroyltransferase